MVDQVELAKLLELAERTEREAENWRGKPMHDGLLEIAAALRERARTPTTPERSDG